MNVSGTKRRSDLPGEVGGQPLGVGLDLGQLGHGSDVLGPLADVVEHGVEGAEHGLRVEQPLLVAEQADVAVDERRLGVEVAGGDGDGGVPVCSMRTCSGSAAPGPKRASPSPTWRW